MPLDDHEKLLLAELYRHPGMQVLKQQLKEYETGYAVALGKQLVREPGCFDEVQHRAQVAGFRVAKRLLNRAAKHAGEIFDPAEQEDDSV